MYVFSITLTLVFVKHSLQSFYRDKELLRSLTKNLAAASGGTARGADIAAAGTLRLIAAAVTHRRGVIELKRVIATGRGLRVLQNRRLFDNRFRGLYFLFGSSRL